MTLRFHLVTLVNLFLSNPAMKIESLHNTYMFTLKSCKQFNMTLFSPSWNLKWNENTDASISRHKHSCFNMIYIHTIIQTFTHVCMNNIHGVCAVYHSFTRIYSGRRDARYKLLYIQLGIRCNGCVQVSWLTIWLARQNSWTLHGWNWKLYEGDPRVKSGWGELVYIVFQRNEFHRNNYQLFKQFLLCFIQANIKTMSSS